jgi:subfamily B ATP-binding cassette protein MsbA
MVLDFFGAGSSPIGILVFIGLIFVFKGIILFSAHAYQSHLKSQLMREIKAMMFGKYATMNYGYYSRHNTGHFINVINNQISSLIKSFDHYKQFLATIITMAAYIGTAFVLAWNFALMAIAAGAFLMILFRRLNQYVHDLSRKTAHEEGTLNRFLVQTIQAFKYLVSTAQLGHLQVGVMHSIQRIASYIRSQGFAQALTLALNEPVAIFLVLTIIVVQVVLFNAPLAPILVVLVLFNRAIGSIFGVLQAWQMTLSKIGSLEIVEQEFKNLEDNQQRNGTQQIGPFSEGIELRDVSFAYDSNPTNVLNSIQLFIPVNATIGIVGESGAGKSTLVDILTLLLRPIHGTVTIDGQSSKDIDLKSWRSQIGYVSQETVVFDDTVANNICLWKEDYNTDEAAKSKIKEAARQAYAERFILDLPDQYNTIVGDRGVRLSGGQRQRLFLARELYKNPRLLILDEATSALDSESEQFIHKSIEALKGNTTVVIIAHRLSTIRNADHIYVLEGGKVIEEGSYNQLVAIQNGYFNRMVSLQKT